MTPIEIDLDLLAADPRARDDFRQLAAQRRHQVTDFQRLIQDLGCEDLPAESLRAMAIAYTIDYRQMATRFEAVQLLRRVLDRTDEELVSAGLWHRLRYEDRIRHLFARPTFRDYTHERKTAAMRWICRERGSAMTAVRELTGKALGDPLETIRKELEAVGRDPATWSRQLVVLRAVQTLSVLDLKTYCDLVAELGEYDHVAEDLQTVAPVRG